MNYWEHRIIKVAENSEFWERNIFFYFLKLDILGDFSKLWCLYAFFCFFYGRFRRARQFHALRSLEPLLPIAAPSVVLPAKQNTIRNMYRESRYPDDISKNRDRSRSIYITTLSQIIRKAYIIYSYYTSRKHLCICIFSALLNYFHPSSFIV